MHANPDKLTDVKCAVTSQDKASVEWINEQHKSWKIVTEVIDSKLSHLKYNQIKTLKLKPTAAEIMGTLICRKDESDDDEDDEELRCETKFVCRASYIFNKTISKEREVPVIFDLSKCSLCAY
eukprot:Seg897.10 transcript_id=Seg897.10/GoldUCD/mRNA.D3Y31 product="hypothetical protein" protein_id=Seg897.10/GoldUCD/D3Y31